MQKFLVTGGAGFIGSNICKRLVAEGCFVRVVDNLLTGKRSNLAPIMDKIEFVEADMGVPEVARSVVKGIDVVLHEGALPSVPRSVDDPDLTHQHCVDATFTLLMAARDARVKRFVYAASSSAYGDTPTLPKVETMRPDPLSPYAVGKLVGEYYCSVFSKVFGLETISLRYFNVFGPGQDPASQYAAAIPAFVTAILREQASDHLRRRRAEPRLHLHRQRRARQSAGGPGQEDRRRGRQRRLRRGRDGQRDHRHDQRASGQERQADLCPRPRRRREALPRRHHGGQEADRFRARRALPRGPGEVHRLVSPQFG